MTNSTKINIGTEINIQDLLTSRLLIQANSGGGKSVLARVIMEKINEVVPFIVLDIEGEYYTLKEQFGDILIIGGSHADVPINLKSVKLLPKEIIANRLSVIIDLSDMQMNDRIMYSKLFLETMMDLPKEFWVNYLVFLEEAHKLCGEQDKQFGNIDFKIIKWGPDAVTIKVMQGKNGSGVYHPAKRLIEIVHETFDRFFHGRKIFVNPVEFVDSPASQVTKDWINKMMFETGTRLKDIATDTGIDKTQLSRIINPESDFVLSQPMKALFWFYFMAKKLSKMPV